MKYIKNGRLEMGETFRVIEAVFVQIINYCILAVELVGVAVLLFAIGRAVYELIKHKKGIRLDLAEGIAL